MVATATRSVGVYEARSHFSKLLAEVEEGVEITITRHGTPVAQISRPQGVERKPGLCKDYVVPEGWDEWTEQDEKDWYGP